MIKDIVVNLPIRGQDRVTPFAVSMAGYFNAHLTGVAFVYEPVLPAVEMGAVLPSSFIDEQMTESRRCAQGAVDRFNSGARGETISFTARQVETSTDAAAGRFAEIARAFDVAIVGQVDPDQPAGMDDLITEATLFESGRPTLIVPYIHTEPFKLDHVAICWDGSRAATRAIADALPMLRRAGSIDLISIYGEKADRTEFDGAEVAEHLSRHGIKAEIHSIPMVIDVAATILNFAADHDTDLLVMGGYGHSRLREFVLGGATRGILQSMTVPTLMSH
jgi:nucleotide-binding universal stress UspA family protein